MPTVDSISKTNKKKLNLLKVALTDEEGREPTFDEVIEWMFSAEEAPDRKIKQELDPLVLEADQ